MLQRVNNMKCDYTTEPIQLDTNSPVQQTNIMCLLKGTYFGLVDYNLVLFLKHVKAISANERCSVEVKKTLKTSKEKKFSAFKLVRSFLRLSLILHLQRRTTQDNTMPLIEVRFELTTSSVSSSENSSLTTVNSRK